MYLGVCSHQLHTNINNLMCASYPLTLSGEQAELFPVDTLVSMLSELSRLSVSYGCSPADGG